MEEQQIQETQPKSKKKLIGNIIVLLAIAFVAVIFAAERAVPGNFLYSFKRTVNEPLWSLVTTTKKGELHWEFEQLERRLQDVANLTANGELTQSEADFLISEITSLDEQIAERIDAVAESEASLHSLKLYVTHEVIMRAYNALISQLVEDDRDLEGFQDIKALLHDITTQAVAARSTHESELISDELITTSEHIEQLHEDVASRMEINRESVDRSVDFVETATHVFILQRYAVAERSMQGATQAIENKDYIGAFAFLQKAYRIVEEVGLFVAIQERTRSRSAVPEDEDVHTTSESGTTLSAEPDDSTQEVDGQSADEVPEEGLRENITIERETE